MHPQTLCQRYPGLKVPDVHVSYLTLWVMATHHEAIAQTTARARSNISTSKLQ